MIRKNKEGKKKFKTKVLAVAMAVLIPLTGCTAVKKSHTKNVVADPTPTAYSDTNYDYKSSAATITDQPITSTNVIASSATLSEYYNYLKDYDVYFENEEMYNFDEVDKFGDYQFAHDHIEHGIIENNKVNVDKLLNSVISKNEKFKEDNRLYMYQIIEDKSKLRTILEYVAEEVDFYIKDVTDQAYLGEIDCLLNDLKVYERSGANNASFTNQNSLLVNPHMIEAMKIISNNDNSFRDIIRHETNHMLQSSCPCHDKDKVVTIGITKNNEDLAQNPYNWLWSTEASAEKAVVNRTGLEPTTYKYTVGYIRSLDLVTLPSKEVKGPYEIEYSTLYKDINRFYEVLNANGIIDKDEIDKMMYSMDILQTQSNDFRAYLENEKNIKLTDEQFKTLKYNLRSECCIMYSKIFYANLSRSIQENRGVTLEDIFELIKIYEANMNYHLDYDTNLDDDNKKYLSSYNDLQTNFFKTLSKLTNIGYEELFTAFTNQSLLYRDSNGNTSLNATLSWLTQDKKEELISLVNSKEVKFTEDAYSVASRAGLAR